MKDGIPVAKMRIGSSVRKIDQETGEWRDGETSFYTVSCWRSLANNAATCLHKGQPVIIAGKLRTDHYEDRSGRQRSEVEVEAETIGFDLRRGMAHFTRNPRSADSRPRRGARRSGPGSTAWTTRPSRNSPGRPERAVTATQPRCSTIRR